MRFGTLGSEDSNHALVLKRYIDARGIDGVEVRYFLDFGVAFEALLAGEIDFVLQVSVHPQHSECVARYMNRAFIVDTFIAPSKPLGILTRRDIAKPQSIGLQPATRHYADLSKWAKIVDETSTSTVAAGLLAGKYDSGIAATELLTRYPGRLRLELEIGPVQDAWILFGRDPIDIGEIQIWPESPVVPLLNRAEC